MGIPRKVSDLGYLSPAERQVLRELDRREYIIVGDGVPAKGEETRRIRASLIRLLLLGDDPDPKYRPYEAGLRIVGGWIPDLMDLEGCRDLPDLVLLRCRFDAAPRLRSASTSNLVFHGSHLPGLFADRLEAKGGVFLGGVEASGEVRLLGAKLGGDLECVGATFRAETDAEGKPSHALNADGLEEKGGVFLRDFEATGQVRLISAKLGASFECDGATFRAEKDRLGNLGVALSADRIVAAGGVFLRNGFEATGGVRLSGAKLGENLDCNGATFRAETGSNGRQGYSLTASGMEATGSVLLRGSVFTGPVVITSARIEMNLVLSGAHDGEYAGIKLDLRGSRVGGVLQLPSPKHSGGGLHLSGAHVGVIDGSPQALATPERVWLNRLSYDGLVDESLNVSVEDWLAFLAKQHWPGNLLEFYPQPFEQLAEVLRATGQGEDARVVLIEKDRRQREVRLARSALEVRGWLQLRDWILWHTVRHGRQPLRAVLWLGVFWAIGMVVFFSASDAGAIKPNNAFMLRQSEWTECAPLEGRARLTCFEGRAASYPEFNALIYSADTLLPIVSLEMQEYWIPDDSQGVGWFARGYLWVHIAVGWALSLLAVAGFSGLVKSD